MGPEIYPHPRYKLWKHYLPETSLAGDPDQTLVLTPDTHIRVSLLPELILSLSCKRNCGKVMFFHLCVILTSVPQGQGLVWGVSAVCIGTVRAQTLTHPGMHSCFSLCFHTYALQETFETLKSWISELRKHGPVNIVLAVAGNKCDLEDLRQVQYKGKWVFTRNEILWPKFGPKLFIN